MWTKHLKDDARKDFEALLRNSVTLLSRLTQIINEKEQTLTKEELSLESYRDASWPYLQAHINGRKAELKELRELLSFIN